METVVKKWGNSLGIRIPNHIARELSKLLHKTVRKHS